MPEISEREQGTSLNEFEIIARYFAPLANDKAALGLRDDAAVLVVPERQELVLTCDTLVEGVHFLPDDPADTVGHKALAVTLSDLAAKGAKPYAYLLALSLPVEVTAAWLESFASGLGEMQTQASIALVGGDTTSTPGPLSITVTAIGHVTHNHVVLRYGATAGDRLYVSGTIGDACLGLRLLRDPALAQHWGLSDADTAFLVERYREPTPRTALALLLRNFGQAAIDVSDGLIGDIEKLCAVSHTGARIEANQVPLSEAAEKVLARDPDLLSELITAGDDYEVVVAVAAASAADFEEEAGKHEVGFTLIGEILAAGQGVSPLNAQGEPLKLGQKGFFHAWP
ncbi:MAG: thiamine-phosphate kinase [Methyloceanibacter sp.]|uniref:thiamine-phosphate kinase n=1 Tax=Methyloceanibacter sp. TaxID=1965321 RepID=UPI003D9B03F0